MNRIIRGQVLGLASVVSAAIAMGASLGCSIEHVNSTPLSDAGADAAHPADGGRRAGCQIVLDAVGIPASGVKAVNRKTGVIAWSIYRKLPAVAAPFQDSQFSVLFAAAPGFSLERAFSVSESVSGTVTADHPRVRADFLVPCTGPVVCAKGENLARYVAVDGSLGVRQVTDTRLHLEAYYLRLDREPLEPSDALPTPSLDCVYYPWIALAGPIENVTQECPGTAFDAKQVCVAASVLTP